MELPQSLPRPDVLILGAAGFIGTHLTTRLHDRHAFGSLTVAGQSVGQRYSEADIHVLDGMIDRDLLDRCSPPKVIFFLIGGSSVGASLQNPRRDFAISLPPLADLLDKMRNDWPKARLIFLSSAAVYGNAGSYVTSIHASPKPISPYGLHKRLSEEMLFFEQERIGLAVNVLRPFSIYGPGLRKQLLWDALRKADAGAPSFFGNGSETRDWVYIDDLVELLLDVALYPEGFPLLFNVGSGMGVSVAEMLGRLFAMSRYALTPSFLGQAKSGDPNDLVADPDEQALFKRYWRTPPDEGLRRFVEWYQGLPK
ncbi:NAD-dependent epimerase/dehydratase family protein [Thiorhodovibrio litoralis]|uniref:NAD-dependent epimerase/dehydratase family protein n=1 Tax=Thiorhodovibrio litoralis TaxID=2952932 RepID=UPI002B256620|nr:NAD-dependent epimerase/dehydratase family protein [Thiorhodovibrio litoralis]WPL10446.1 UDP-glucose 4-epimerase [Thiorhodovibrio litoralis]